MSQQTAEQSQQSAEQDQQQIRALIDAWCEASSAGDLTAQFHLMTPDVVFLTPGRAPMRREEFAAAFRAGLDGVVARGKAEAGDKTMFDALEPAVSALEAGVAKPFVDTLKSAAAAAEAGRDATIEMLAHKGRASYLGERSVGHQDPGATSAALLVLAAAETLS